VILVDTSVWVQHLRAADRALVTLLNVGQVLGHPFVVGELALGNLKPRKIVLVSLQKLPQVTMSTDKEVLHFVDRYALCGTGIGYIDAHLLAALRLTPGAVLWTRDKPLQLVAEKLGLAWDFT
jgi:predicted nucleic acid-binding protein